MDGTSLPRKTTWKLINQAKYSLQVLNQQFNNILSRKTKVF